MSEPTVLIEEYIFTTCFANSITYGAEVNMPQVTYLVSKVDMKRKQKIIAPTQVKAFGNSWIPGNHAEDKCLQDLGQQLAQHGSLNNNKINVDMEIFMSYSPCCVCAEKIRNFSKHMERPVDVNVTIHIGTFFEIYDVINFTDENADGLIELLSTPGVELKIFNGQKDWERFLEIAELPKEWIKHTQTSRRVLRENNDSFILNGLVQKAAEKHYLPDLVQELSLDEVKAKADCSNCKDCKMLLCQNHSRSCSKH